MQLYPDTLHGGDSIFISTPNFLYRRVADGVGPRASRMASDALVIVCESPVGVPAQRAA